MGRYGINYISKVFYDADPGILRAVAVWPLKLAGDKRSSLLCLSVSDGEEKVFMIDTSSNRSHFPSESSARTPPRPGELF
jgi:hypothetical protein